MITTGKKCYIRSKFDLFSGFGKDRVGFFGLRISWESYIRFNTDTGNIS